MLTDHCQLFPLELLKPSAAGDVSTTPERGRDTDDEDEVLFWKSTLQSMHNGQLRAGGTLQQVVHVHSITAMQVRYVGM